MLAFIGPARVGVGPFPKARSWLGRCLARPAARKVFQRVIDEGRALGYTGDLDVPETP